MRIVITIFRIIALVIVTSRCPHLRRNKLGLNAACRIPFEKLKDPKTNESFPVFAALNESAKLSENLRQRYIVADLNSADESGNCRGVQEYSHPWMS